MTCLCPAMSRGLAPPLVLGKMVADNFVWTVYNGQYGTVWTYMYYIVLHNSVIATRYCMGQVSFIDDGPPII